MKLGSNHKVDGDHQKPKQMGLLKTPETGKIWLKHHIEILRQWKAKAFVHLWLHAYSTYHFIHLNNWLSYPVIFISTFCSATVLSTNDYRIDILIGILTMINAILSGFNRQLNPGSMMQQHAQLNRRYSNLIRSIDTCLSLTEKMRPHPSVFIERIGVEIDNLADANIDYPDTVVNRFEKEFGPIDRLLYGDNIVELVKIGKATGSTVNDIRRRSQLMSGPTDETDNMTMESDDIEMGRTSPPQAQETTNLRPMLPFKLMAGANTNSTSFALARLNQAQNMRMTTPTFSGQLDQADISMASQQQQLPSPYSKQRSSMDSGLPNTNSTATTLVAGSTISLRPNGLSTSTDDIRGVRKSLEIISTKLSHQDLHMHSFEEEPLPVLSRAGTATPPSTIARDSPFKKMPVERRRKSADSREISMRIDQLSDFVHTKNKIQIK
jgi:hypothetical protein